MGNESASFPISTTGQGHGSKHPEGVQDINWSKMPTAPTAPMNHANRATPKESEEGSR